MKKLLPLVLFLASCSSTPVVVTPPPPPIAVQEIPMIYYPAAGIDTKRFIPIQWMSLWDLYKDAYGVGKIELVDNSKDVLDALAKRIMAQPKGRRAFFEWHFADSPYVNPEFNLIHHSGNACLNKDGKPTMYVDFNNRSRPMICPWFDAGIKASSAKWTFLMTELKNRGVDLDYFTTENEQGYSPWSFVSGQAEAIDADPRSDEIKKKLGITSIAETMNFFAHRDDFIKMAEEMYSRGYVAFVEGMYKPILAVYPNVQISDYAKFFIGSKLPNGKPLHVWDINGWPQWNDTLTQGQMVSNGTDLNYLGGGAFVTYQHGNAETGPLEDTPWQAFVGSLNQARAISISNPNKPFWPYMAQQSWITWSPKELYQEHWRHLALMVTGFVFWGPGVDRTQRACDAQFTAPKTCTADELVVWIKTQDGIEASDVKILSDLFAEVDPLLSFADRKPLVDQLIGWQDKSITTCANANKKKVCRVTQSDGTGIWTVDGIQMK